MGKTCDRPDYAGMYDEYWVRPDRWGSHSFEDADAVVDQVLKLGGGTMLDVGCGMRALVHTLRRRGIDARGLDVAGCAIEEGNRQAPGCFELGSILDIPYPDDSFDTVICTDVLEHLAEPDVPRALSELYRVTKRSLFATIATRLDRDGIWHLTVHDRTWWEKRLLDVGFRKHPATQQVLGYEAIESETLQLTAACQKIPPRVLDQYPLGSLQAERDLHMDMLRESGRRSDAHIARYELAREFVAAGEVVLDVTCGLGYGSAVLCEGTGAARTIGVDNSRFAIEYARVNYGAPAATEFRLGDATDLGFLDEASVDVAVSLETIEHLPRPEAFMAEIKRVLRPGGRVMVSVPNEWTDETGRDPNPHHLHVYDWPRLQTQMDRHFHIDAAFAQVAGGGMKLHDGPRCLRAIDPARPDPVEPAEWWLAVGVKHSSA
jgi:2-polyprenyl-3-methyl-5-hydroxy-6-metoxy-1,4-benzoquinol methylase